MLGLERGAALEAAPFKPCPEALLCPALAGAAAVAEEEEEEDVEAEEEDEAASSVPRGSCRGGRTLLLSASQLQWWMLANWHRVRLGFPGSLAYLLTLRQVVG